MTLNANIVNGNSFGLKSQEEIEHQLYNGLNWGKLTLKFWILSKNNKNPRTVLIPREMHHMSSKTQAEPSTLREQLKHCPAVLKYQFTYGIPHL